MCARLARLAKWRVDKSVFGIILILSIDGLIQAVDSDDSNRQKREVNCEAKYREITSDHTACLEPSTDLDENTKGVSEADKKIILDVHNRVRREVSPNAKNMMLMTWDNEIANTAQRWAERCDISPVLRHDGNYKRYAFGRFSVGQNLASGYTDWKDVMEGWEDEKNDYDYNSVTNSGAVTGHYTQMVWASSSKVGCGYARCRTSSTIPGLEVYSNFYVCNYGPGGNSIGKKPYEKGDTCAACLNKCNNGLCDCGDTVCLNGGTLDLNLCTCTCRPGLTFFLPPTCGLNCTLNQDPAYCLNQYRVDACEIYTNVPQECPTMCKWCPTAAYGKPVGTSTTTDKTESSSRPTDEPESSSQSTDRPESTTQPTATASTVMSNTFSAIAFVLAIVLVL